LALSSGRQNTNISRSQAEESYRKALEKVTRHLEQVEKEVALATKTKLEIKEGIKDLGRNFRNLLKVD
jgi:antitoxin component HigA of HigAB toxin-antitoxin module